MIYKNCCFVSVFLYEIKNIFKYKKYLKIMITITFIFMDFSVVNFFSSLPFEFIIELSFLIILLFFFFNIFQFVEQQINKHHLLVTHAYK
jgi:hypothetical protein